ncbi:MAG: hypothetical protein V1706_08275 [Pseudomonadota bacterium]
MNEKDSKKNQKSIYQYSCLSMEVVSGQSKHLSLLYTPRFETKYGIAITTPASCGPIRPAPVSMTGNLIAEFPGPEQPGRSKCNQKKEIAGNLVSW